MTIDITIPKPVKRAKHQLDLPDDLWEQFELYVKAAKAAEPHATSELVMEALIRKQLSKDRSFQKWLKAQSTATNEISAGRFNNENGVGRYDKEIGTGT